MVRFGCWILFHLLISIAALPCHKDGNFISVHSCPPTPAAPDATKDNSWHPFDSHLSFDWAHYYFVELQVPAKSINKGLDLWLAAKLQAGDDTPLPWSSATEMYTTIDSIQEGDAPFETISFKYSGPLSPNPPRWMTETYELCTRDSHILLHNQLRTSDFKDQVNLRPYHQFNHQGDRVWSNLMSGDWAWTEAVRYTQLLQIVPRIPSHLHIAWYFHKYRKVWTQQLCPSCGLSSHSKE